MTDVFDQDLAVHDRIPDRSGTAGVALLADPASRYEPFPLTDVQKAYWLGRGNNFRLGNIGCHVYFEFDVPDVDRGRLQAAWQKLIDRHDMLRAVVRHDGTQQVLPHTPHYEIKHLNLRGIDDAKAQAELQAVRDRMSHQVFPADRWPLFELRTTDLKGRTLLHFSLDLLFVDLWSIQLLFDEWAQLTFEADPYLTPLEISFRDYMVAAAEHRDSESYRRARDYWLRRIDTLPPAPQLPLVKHPSAVTQPRFVRREAVLERDVWRKLKSRASKARLTPSGMLMAAFARILAAWSQTSHFTLNTTLFQRTPLHPHVYRLVGDFTSILLVEIRDDAADSFAALAQRIATQFRDDLAHRDYGGLQLLQEIAKRGDPARPPSMPVVFTSALAQSMPGWQSADSVGEAVYGITQTPQVYLDHQIYERRGNLHYTWDALEEMFPPGLLDDMFAAYSGYLRRLAQDDGAWSETNASVMSPEQSARWQVMSGSASLLAPISPAGERGRQDGDDGREIEAALRRHPLVADAVVVTTHARDALVGYVVPAKVAGDGAALRAAVWPDGRLISARARRALGRVPAELRTFLRGVEALEQHSTGAMIETLQSLGAFKTAGETWTAEQIVAQGGVQHAYTGLIARWLHLLAGDGLLVSGPSGRYTCPGPLAPRAGAATSGGDVADNPLTAYFQNARRNLPKLLRGEASPLAFLFPGGDWRIAEMLYQHNPLSRRVNELAAQAVRDLVEKTAGEIRVLELGAGIGSATSALLPLLPADRTHYFFTDVTPFFHADAKRKFAGFPFVEYGIVDALRDPLTQGLLPYSYDLIVAANVLHNAEDPVAALAGLRPLLAAGGVILLIEATRNTRAHAVTVGLIEGLRTLTQEENEDRPFLPLRRWIKMLGSAGYGAVEASRDPADSARDFGLDFILARAAAPAPSEQREVGEALRSSLTGPGLQTFLAQHLPPDMIPGDIVVLDALPLGADGKVDRKALPAARPAGRAPEQPASATETALAEIWSKALGRESVGLQDHFLELGGDSLIAVRIIAAIRERFQVDLRAEVMFDAPTVRRMAAAVEFRLREQDGDASLPSLPHAVPDAANRTQPFPLTEIQQAYWIGRAGALELGNVGAHLYLELERGSLDRERFAAAWQQLIERHGMLRTVVLREGRQQSTEPAPRYEIEEVDVSGVSEQEADRVLAELRERMSHQVFSGERWPPFEIKMARIAADKTRLHFSFDLLMVDLWSLRLLMRELLTLYDDPHAELPPLEIGFRDYVLAVAALEQTETWKRSWQYWMERLPELPPAPELPLARDPATIVRPRFTRRSEILPAADWQKIKVQAKARNLTTSSILLAAFSEVLAAWGRRPDFTINLTLFQRLPVHPRVNQIVGDFTSTTLLSVDCANAPTFVEHACKVQAQLWRDLDHRYVSGVRVIRELARSREIGFRPSMPVVFTSGLAQGMPELERLERLKGDALGEVVYSISQTPQVWLDHQVYEQEGRLHFNWDAVDELFPPGLLDEMFAAYYGVLRRLAQDEGAWTAAKADLVPATQNEQLRQLLAGYAFPSHQDGRGLPARRPVRRAPVPASNAIETVLVEIWSSALARDAVGVDDHFLELGGDSLIAVRLVTAAADRFQVDLGVQLMFEAPTIRQMAAAIERRLREQDRGAPVSLPALPRLVPDPANRAEPFPLTEIQQAYWIGRSGALELGNVGAHFYLELEAGPLDRDRFAAAWQLLIERHGMLRTVVLPEGLQQLLEPAPRYEIEAVDVTALLEEEAGRLLARLRERMSHQVYSGERWPHFEIKMVRIAPERTRLHLSFDLLVIDLWSLRLLIRELLTLYENPNAALPVLDIGFRDYALAVAAQEQSEAWQRSYRYWMDRLPELPPAPELPLTRDPVTIVQPRFTRRAEILAADEWQTIKDRAKASDLTASSVLLAAFSDVLAAWSRRPQFTVNLTLFQRQPVHPQVNQIVGDFTSITLLSVDCAAARSFAEHARGLQAQLWRDLDHRHVSGVRVIRELARLRDTGLRPSMPVVFTSGLAQGMPELERLEQVQAETLGEIVYSISQTPQVWLDHQVYEQAGRLHFNWDAVEDLFPAGLLDDMFAAYCEVLHTLARDEAAWREARRSLLPAAQLNQRAAINDTAAPVPDGLLHAPFLEQVRKRPQQTAVVSLERRLSYEDVYRQARPLARRLRRMGAARNRLVAVVMEKGWEQVVATIAILEAGAAYLPVDPDLPQERRSLLLRRGEVEIVLTQPCVQERLEWPADVRCVAVDWQDEPADDGDEMPPPTRNEDLAYVIFTSGSTGEPKGVMVEHRSALNTVLDINERFGVGPDDRVLALSSLSFDLSVYDIFGALAAGATIVLPHPTSWREPGDWAALVRHEGVTVWNSVPQLLEMLVEHVGTRQELVGDSLRLAMLSGDWIPVKLPDRARALLPGLHVISLGGATEAAIWSIFYPIEAVGADWRSIPYGRPLRNQQMHVLNDAMHPSPTWVHGQIHISGVGLARGYWKDEERTRLQFLRNPHTGEMLYRTGDLGRYLPSGDIEFLGREDDQVKVQGFRIELGEIEAALERHPQVKAAVVVAVGARTSRHLAAYVVADGVSVEALGEYLRQKLPSYMVPNVWHALDRLPLTANGKVDRKALPGVRPAAPEARVDVALPAGESDALARVTALICQELGYPSLDPDKNLLTLGASSMDLVRIVGRFDKEFGFRPSFQEFFRDPTAAALARLIHRRRSGAAAATNSSAALAAPQRRAFEQIVDLQAREAFRRENRGIRAFAADWGRLPLAREELAAIEDRFRRRRTVRRFLPEPVPLATIGIWFSELSRVTIGDTVKHAYGSAGGCYPVQTYLHAKPDGVAGCPAGVYYYHPIDHCLVPITLGAELDSAIHEPFTNRPIFEQARFSLFFVHQPAAIEPMYGDLSWRFSVLEAGAMAQALESSALRFGLGVCPIGWVDFDAIRALLHLEDGQELLHAHVGGIAWPDSGDWEEGVV
jgi:amino acid adenylation domain-containing protein